MNPLTLWILVAWLAALTFALATTMRQLSIALVRLSLLSADRARSAKGELIIGLRLGDNVLAELPRLNEGTSVLLFLTSNCSTCFEIAQNLTSCSEGNNLLAVIEGEGPAVSRLNEIIQNQGLVQVVNGSKASRVASYLGIVSTPTVVGTVDAHIAGIGHLASIEELHNFLEHLELPTIMES